MVWWALPDLNRQPIGYEPTALTVELRARTAEVPAFKARGSVPTGCLPCQTCSRWVGGRQVECGYASCTRGLGGLSLLEVRRPWRCAGVPAGRAGAPGGAGDGRVAVVRGTGGHAGAGVGGTDAGGVRRAGESGRAAGGDCRGWGAVRVYRHGRVRAAGPVPRR